MEIIYDNKSGSKDGYGIDWRSEYLGGYMPTFERLDYANGGDWY